MAKLIGTAGHVDHGKTTLIRALTGIDADRLPEEKERGMTIDIGFAYVDLPEHGRVSIVDVPGHRRFLSNMLVGALGIDVALLCVAADAGVMPQTIEHLQILELLPVEALVVAMTRSDLADAETREIAREDVAELLAKTRFAGAPILFVSAATNEGIEELRSALARSLAGSGDAQRIGAPWYLPVDRAFNVKGHGCVVTGTLAQGIVRVGDRAILVPTGLEARVRAIHVHSEAVERSEFGTRTAVNLAGIKLEDVQRGMSLGAPGALFETTVLDARVHWVGERRHGQRVRVSIGAEEAIGKLFLNDHDDQLVQLRLETPVACALDQPLIVRRYSPPDLVAGGRVAVPLAIVRKRREPVATIHAANDREGILQAVGDDPNGVPTDEICRRLGKTPQSLGKTFEKLLDEGVLLGFAGLWIEPPAFEEGYRRFAEALRAMHEEKPAQSGLPREAVVHRAGLKWAGKPLDRILSRLAVEGRIVVSGTTVRLAEFRVRLTPRQRELLDKVMAQMEKEPINVAYTQDLARAIPVPIQAVDEILRLGIQAGEIVNLAEGIFYTRRQIEAIKIRIAEIAGKKPFAASTMRDALGTTRKYIIPLLEHLDSIRFTTRVGDNRVVNQP